MFIHNSTIPRSDASAVKKIIMLEMLRTLRYPYRYCTTMGKDGNSLQIWTSIAVISPVYLESTLLKNYYALCSIVHVHINVLYINLLVDFATVPTSNIPNYRCFLQFVGLGKALNLLSTTSPIYSLLVEMSIQQMKKISCICWTVQGPEPTIYGITYLVAPFGNILNVVFRGHCTISHIENAYGED